MSDPLSVSSPQKIQDDDLRACQSESAREPEATPDPYAVLHKYMGVDLGDGLFVIAGEDMPVFWEQAYRHYRDGDCQRCREAAQALGVDGGAQGDTHD